MSSSTSLTTAIQPTTLKELSASVYAFIAEKDAVAGNIPNTSVLSANLLLIAIENAANIFKNCTPDRQPVFSARIESFQKMLACLKKTSDYSRLNLTTMIRHSIDIGTSDGSIPKLYAVHPQHIVPKTQTRVQFSGKFKYADNPTYMPTLKVGERTFKPTHCDHHKLTFELDFSPEKGPFKKDKCSQFDARLFVPYEVGHLGLVIAQKETSEFTVPIRALPTCAGVIEVAVSKRKKTTHEMEWGQSLIVEFDSNSESLLTFSSFDGKKPKFTSDQLEDTILSDPLMKVAEGPYLRISHAESIGEDGNKWKVETIPPVDFL